MNHDILKLVEEQWLEDDGRGNYYCPTELAIHAWDDDPELGYEEYWGIWYRIRNFESLFEKWEIEQMEQQGGEFRNDQEWFGQYPMDKNAAAWYAPAGLNRGGVLTGHFGSKSFGILPIIYVRPGVYKSYEVSEVV
jgi:hypothetical protein